MSWEGRPALRDPPGHCHVHGLRDPLRALLLELGGGGRGQGGTGPPPAAASVMGRGGSARRPLGDDPEEATRLA